MRSRGEEYRARPDYVPAIDGLRALAVLSVMVFHLVPAWLPGGLTGVDIFFVISGFVVTRAMLGKSFDSLGALAGFFYARRLRRIMPALLAMLLVTFVATQLFVPTAWLSTRVPGVGISAFFGLSNIVLAVTGDDYFAPRAAFDPFTHSWSLGVEEQFYLAFPFLLWWHQRHAGQPEAQRRVVRLVAGLTLASLAIAAVLTAAAPAFAFYLIFARFWELGVGMLLCLTITRWAPAIAASGTPRRALLASASVALMLAGFVLPESRWFPFPLALLPVLGAAGVIMTVCAVPGGRAARLFGARISVAIGLLSYSLYLWHWPVFVLFRWTVGLDTPLQRLGALLLAGMLATLSYWLVERPLRAGPRLKAMPRGRVIRGMLAATVISALASVAILRAHDRITLSVTRAHDEWYAEGGRALDPARTHCAVRETREALAGGEVAIWSPEHCTIAPAGFTLFAPGDSHTLAYAPAYHQLAADLGIPVRQYFRVACPWLKLNEPRRHDAPCRRWFAALDADLLGRVRGGDVIFAPGLRLTRLVNQYPENHPMPDPAPDQVRPEDLAEARAMLVPYAMRGAAILLEAPKPIFRAPPFRCSDWFNRTNAFCQGGFTMDRAAIEARRAGVLGAMRQLAGAVPDTQIWDPLPLLCGPERCTQFIAGRPLFFDADHLSGHGNDVVYPGLRAAVLAAHQK